MNEKKRLRNCAIVLIEGMSVPELENAIKKLRNIK